MPSSRLIGLDSRVRGMKWKGRRLEVDRSNRSACSRGRFQFIELYNGRKAKVASGSMENHPYRIVCKKFAGLPSIGMERAMQMEGLAQIMRRGVGGIIGGQSVTYSLSDGKMIQKMTDVLTGTGSVVRAVSFLHR